MILCLNTKLHALTDRNGKPLRFFMSAGQISDYTGAAALLSSFPEADFLLADRGYDADWFRYALKTKPLRRVSQGESQGKRRSNMTGGAIAAAAVAR